MTKIIKAIGVIYGDIESITIRLTLILFKGGNPTAGSPTVTLLRLNPNHPPHRVMLPPLRVSSHNSGEKNFHGVTGSVYKTRERIHRSVLIYDY